MDEYVVGCGGDGDRGGGYGVQQGRGEVRLATASLRVGNGNGRIVRRELAREARVQRAECVQGARWM
jgi:hypothetical protein